jgi:hypothetical protein
LHLRSCSQPVSRDLDYCRSDLTIVDDLGDTSLEISLHDSKAGVSARGGYATLAELGEQLAWLGSVMRPNPFPSGICLIDPHFTTHISAESDSPAQRTLEFQFTFRGSRPVTLDASEGTCWHNLFQNPVVANGFPILARSDGQKGLEAPLTLTATLAEAHYPIHFDKTLFLKGSCTALIPTARTHGSVTWHLIYNEDGAWLPYHQARDRCPEWMDTDRVSLDLLDNKEIRHFVGWASNITSHLGMTGHIGPEHPAHRSLLTTIRSTTRGVQ